MLTRFKQHQPIQVTRIEADTWSYPVHNHDHFEIILVEEGEGVHEINGSKMQYKKGSIFMLTPDDYHQFVIDRPTVFLYLKFTDHFFHKDHNIQDRSQWLHKVETILYQPNPIEAEVQYSDSDRELIFFLARQVEREVVNERCYSEDIMADCLGTILSVMARSVCYLPDHGKRVQATNSSKVNQIINHIRKNVYQASMVKVKALADHFNMSENYISAYFKKHTGESLRTYIQKYRLNLAKYRLKKGDDTISEIAFDLGFFDESHLTKLFKQEFGLTPREYRKKVA